MRVLKIVLVTSLVVALSSSAWAGDLQASIDRAAQSTPSVPAAPIPKPYLWVGTGMFTAGLAVGLYAFMHNKNGQFPGDDEFNATDRKLGAAGLLTAFSGGMVLFLGKHKASPSISVAANRLTVTKRVSW